MQRRYVQINPFVLQDSHCVQHSMYDVRYSIEEYIFWRQKCCYLGILNSISYWISSDHRMQCEFCSIVYVRNMSHQSQKVYRCASDITSILT